MMRAEAVLVATVSLWVLLTLSNTIAHSEGQGDPLLLGAQIAFIPMIAGIVYYVKARKVYIDKTPKKVKGTILGFKVMDFDIVEPYEFKRRYAVVKVGKHHYKCFNVDGLKKGEEIVCLKFNKTLLPIFSARK